MYFTLRTEEAPCERNHQGPGAYKAYNKRKHSVEGYIKQLGKPSQNTIGWVTQTTDIYLPTILNARSIRTGRQHVLVLVRAVFLLCREPFLLWTHMGNSRLSPLSSCAYKAINPIVTVPRPLWPNLSLFTSQSPHLQLQPHGWRGKASTHELLYVCACLVVSNSVWPCGP